MLENPGQKMAEKQLGLGLFEKYLSLWVVLCILMGIAIGRLLPAFPEALSRLEHSHVSIPVAILIWLMIYPMMLKIDFSSIFRIGEKLKGLMITWVGNWVIKPFSMYIFAWLFLCVIFSPFPTDTILVHFIPPKNFISFTAFSRSFLTSLGGIFPSISSGYF
jgi:ACR3 family arsenite transporter